MASERSVPAHGIRVEFHGFIPAPDNPDAQYRAMNLDADMVTLEGEHVVLWRHGVEEHRFPRSVVHALVPFPAPELRVNALEELRRESPKAYRVWAQADDERLAMLFGEGWTVDALCKELGRNPGGIQSRLVKLGLVEAADVRKHPKSLDE